MATRGKRSRRKASARMARRTAPRKAIRARKTAPAASAVRSAAPVVRRSVRPISRMGTGWSTLRVVWRPAISMATLPYRVYRVYRWAEAESTRSRFAASAAP